METSAQSSHYVDRTRWRERTALKGEAGALCRASRETRRGNWDLLEEGGQGEHFRQGSHEGFWVGNKLVPLKEWGKAGLAWGQKFREWETSSKFTQLHGSH